MEIRINGNLDLVLHIEGKDGGPGHRLIIPTTVEGVKTLKQILLADKQVRERGEQPKFGTEASPTQEMVKEYLRSHSVTKPKTKPQLPKKEVMELDLTGLNLEF